MFRAAAIHTVQQSCRNKAGIVRALRND
jgi:hypothetical protein